MLKIEEFEESGVIIPLETPAEPIPDAGRELGPPWDHGQAKLALAVLGAPVETGSAQHFQGRDNRCLEQRLRFLPSNVLVHDVLKRVVRKIERTIEDFGQGFVSEHGDFR